MNFEQMMNTPEQEESPKSLEDFKNELHEKEEEVRTLRIELNTSNASMRRDAVEAAILLLENETIPTLKSEIARMEGETIEDMPKAA